MREILFKGKRTDNDEWIESCNVFSDGKKKYIYIPNTDTDMRAKAYLCYEVIPETVGQYTGLTDKNGKKIFEGDIVKCAHTVRVARQDEDYSKIRYSYGGYLIQTCPDELASIFGTSYEYKYWRNYVVEYFRGNLRLHNKSCVNMLSWNYIINHGIEVIGNITDNPELLKGDNDA